MSAVGKYVAAAGAVSVAIAMLEIVGPSVNGATAAQVLLLVLLLVARFCGRGPTLVAAAGAGIAFARHFITPGGLAVGEPSDWAALVAFLIIAVVGGELASRAERRAAEAHEGRQEIERLYQELQLAFDRASEAEAARRNEQLKSALLDALTHNLRTPLTAIKAAVTALIGAAKPDGPSRLPATDQRELLEVIDEESDRLNRFIEALSNAGHPDASQPAHLRAVRLDEIVRAGLVRAETVTRDHRVEVALAEDLPPLSVDSPSIAEVIYILVDNASKYAPVGSTITVQATRAGREQVQLSVIDQGPGIAEDLRGRVFDKFFRIPGREPNDVRRGGIGLGLPIARRLVEAQSGRIWIEASSGPSTRPGTTVSMVLPVTPAHPATTGAIEAPDGSRHAAAMALK